MDPQRPTAPLRAPPAREERYCVTADVKVGSLPPARSLRPVGGKGSLDQASDLVLNAVEPLLHVTPDGLRLALHLTTVTTRKALDASAGALDLAQGTVARGGAATLVLAEVDRHAALEPLELALRGVRRGERLDRLHDVVPRHERGADGDEHGALRLARGRLGAIDGVGRTGLGRALRLGRRALRLTRGALGRARRTASGALGGAAVVARAVALAGGGRLASGGTPLLGGLRGHFWLHSPSRDSGWSGSNVIRSKLSRNIPPNTCS